MREILVVLDHGSDHTSRVKEAVNVINASQRSFFLRLQEDPVLIEPAGDRIVGDNAAAQIGREFTGRDVICVTDRPFVDNWFSHEYRHCAIITTSDWEALFAPPSLRAYLVYQIAQALIPIEADLTEEMLLQLVHEPPIGCLQDLNTNKPDIKYGMIAGNMCLGCEGNLRQFGVDQEALDAVRRVLAAVRDEAVGRPRIADPFSAFVVMRFSQHDENANAYKYGLRPGLEDVGLTVHRGDDTVQSAQILDQVLRHLERSRFIVAKVDAENLNVYFELGLAMGLDKDVLLVSESSLIVTLPSDLRNWECITYEGSNYEQLRDRVSAFFESNYHMERRRVAT